MRPALPAYRSVLWRAVPWIALAAVAAGCRESDPAQALPLDLVSRAAAAAIQPTPASLREAVVVIGGVSVPALLMTSPARLTWDVRFSERAELVASIALAPSGDVAVRQGVVVRLGLSDGRTYDELLRTRLASDAVWQDIRLDLSPYSGWKWSLFYQPSRITWRLIVNADQAPGGTLAVQTLRVQPRR